MISKRSFINPYELLNVKPSSSLAELKKSYRELALICHPDKNGSSEDMMIIQRAYEYIKKEIKYSSVTKTLEDAEDEFKKFCDEQKEATKPYPDLIDIIHDQDNYLKKFNEAFDEYRKNEEYSIPMTYESNYENQMVKDNNRDDETKPLDDNHRFKKELIIYEEPSAAFINGLSSEFDFKMTKCTDFTNYNTENNSFGADYQMAFSEISTEDIKKNDLYKEELLKYKEMEMEKLMESLSNTPKVVNNVDLQYSDKEIKAKDDVEDDEKDEQIKQEYQEIIDTLIKQRSEIDNMFTNIGSSDNDQTPLDKLLNIRKENELKRMTAEEVNDDPLFIEKNKDGSNMKDI